MHETSSWQKFRKNAKNKALNIRGSHNEKIYFASVNIAKRMVLDGGLTFMFCSCCLMIAISYTAQMKGEYCFELIPFYLLIYST